MELVNACKELMAWWKDAKYWEGQCGHNVFDVEDELLFDHIEKALAEKANANH